MTEHTETEFKLRATRPLEVAVVDAAVRELGLGCRVMATSQHVDTYLDDGDGSLGRAGIGLRLRTTRGGNRVTCKARGTHKNGLFVREEHEVDWPSGTAPRTARELPPLLRDAIEPYVLDRALVPMLQLSTQREARVLQHDERDLCELAIDRVEATAAGRAASFCEIELEVVDDIADNERLAQALLQRLPLLAAEDDKPTHAATRLGLPPAPPAPPPPTADTQLADAVAAIATHHLDTMRRAEVGVRGDLDPEHLHVMRVAVRRLRSIVRAFRDLWSDTTASWLLDQLGELGRRLGGVRDLDVLLGSLADDLPNLPQSLLPAAERARTWIAGLRDAAHTELQAWLRTDTRLQKCGELERNLVAFDRGSAPAMTTVSAALPPRVATAAATLRKLAGAISPSLPFEPLHDLRIACKRLRYVAEAFPPLPDQTWDKSLEAVATLQQVLGVVCDHENAAARLLGWIHAAAAASPDGAMTAAALGALAARQVQQGKKARRAARKALAATDRKKVWRRFPGEPATDANRSI